MRTTREQRNELRQLLSLEERPSPCYHDDYYVCDSADEKLLTPGPRIGHHEGMTRAATVAKLLNAAPGLLADADRCAELEAQLAARDEAAEQNARALRLCAVTLEAAAMRLRELGADEFAADCGRAGDAAREAVEG